MECLPDDILLKFNRSTLSDVRESFGYYRPEDLNKAITILEDWVKKQDHFVKKDFSRRYLECCIINAKGSIEVAKNRIDKLCTMKTLMPQFFVDYDRDLFYDSKNLQVLLPKLTKEHGRVLIIKVDCHQFTSSLLLNMYRWSIAIMEYLRARDYSNHVIVLYDLHETNIPDFLKNFNAYEFRQAVTLCLTGYGVRVKGLHFLTSSKLIDMLLTIVRKIISSKLAQRITVHQTVDTFHKFVPKDILPIDYGGEERSMSSLTDEFVEVVCSKEYKEYWKEMSRACTDESRRQTDTFNEQYMGMPGTFRSLSVD